MIRFKLLDSTVHMRVSDASTINGKDGVTPHIGDNGNWYLGDVDTGNPSRGETGPAGHTPVRGTDYWTAADQNAIVSQAVTKIQPDISGIKDDLAGKLPKSPANWEPWTAEEQAAARERMGIPGEYELIAEITTTEELDSVVINTDADGNDLRLSNAYIHLEMAIGSGDGQARLEVRDENNNYIANPYISNISGIAKRFTMYEIYKQNGLFHCYYCSSTSSRASGTLGFDVEKHGRFKKYISKIRLAITNTVKIPAGSIISFYGIRSDE